MTGHTLAARGEALSSDSKRLATASQDMSVKDWDPAAGLEILTLCEHLCRVTIVAFSPDGERIGSIGENVVKISEASLADLNLREFAQDHLRCHRSRLGRRPGPF